MPYCGVEGLPLELLQQKNQTWKSRSVERRDVSMDLPALPDRRAGSKRHSKNVSIGRSTMHYSELARRLNTNDLQ